MYPVTLNGPAVLTMLVDDRFVQPKKPQPVDHDPQIMFLEILSKSGLNTAGEE